MHLFYPFDSFWGCHKSFDDITRSPLLSQHDLRSEIRAALCIGTGPVGPKAGKVNLDDLIMAQQTHTELSRHKMAQHSLTQ